MRTKREYMHIDRANEVTVPCEPTGAARPGSPFGQISMPADRTPAAGSSFGAGEAQDAGLFGFVGEVVDIAPVFPQGHALVMMSSGVPVAHAVRVADEEASHLVCNAEIDHLPRGLVAQVADTPLGAPAYLVFRALQPLPAARVLCASALLFGESPQLLAPLSLERADAAPGHDSRRTRVRGDGGQVDFSEINGCLNSPRNFFLRFHFDAHMQLKAVIPDERAGTSVFGKVKRQDEGFAPSAHRQDHSSFFRGHRLGGPVDGVEAFRLPGILHLHLRVFFAERADSFDSPKKGAEDSLH